MSQSLRSRPSELLGVSDPFVAYCVDRSIWTFAQTVEKEQNDAETRLPKNAKDATKTHARQRVLDRYLGIETAKTPGRFRDPVAKTKR
jgi:hypothetical protein